MQHYEGQLCHKKDQLCGKLYSNQFLHVISNVFFGGGRVLNGVLIGILVYLTDGINIYFYQLKSYTCIKLFYFGVK